MLAYAPRPQRQHLSPTALTLILAGHVAAIAAVMSARLVVERQSDPPIVIDTIPAPKPPDPAKPPPDPAPATKSTLDHPIPELPPLSRDGPVVENDPIKLPPPGPTVGPGTELKPIPLDPPVARTGPRFATSESAIRPPYPDSKRQMGQEASLRLRLTIDEHGRVIAVDAVGQADPTFLAAARRHILRAWRYQPAMEGPKAVPSTTTITLKFQLGNA